MEKLDIKGRGLRIFYVRAIRIPGYLRSGMASESQTHRLSGRGRAWVFTLNNPEHTAHELQAVLERAGVRYAVFQEERGAGVEGGEGTRHFQGYALWRQPKRLAYVRGVLERAHWELRLGTHDQAVEYCTKEDTRIAGPYHVGEAPAGQGKRTDLESVKLMLDAGAPMREVAQEHFGAFVRHYRGFNTYRLLTQEQRTWQTTVRVYWGPPGTGKSRRALHEAGPHAYWLPRPNQASGSGGTLWFDGYDGEEHVVIDEFYGWIPRDTMQRMIDRYPFQVQTKGGSVRFLAKTIWITSNVPPEDWWKRMGLGAMERRLAAPIGTVEHMTGCWEEPPPAETTAVARQPPSPMMRRSSIGSTVETDTHAHAGNRLQTLSNTPDNHLLMEHAYGDFSQHQNNVNWSGIERQNSLSELAFGIEHI